MSWVIARTLRLAIAVGISACLAGCSGKSEKSVHTRTADPPHPRASGLFRDVSAESGISHKWGHSSFERLSILETLGFGCAFIDYDGDGKLDILLVAKDHLVLYHNTGGGKFADVTSTAFPGAPIQPFLHGAAVADFDGDGKPDIFVSGYGRNILYHNEGNGTFRDVTAGSGLEARGPYDWCSTAAWADVDGDGKPDLFVGRYCNFNPETPQLCPSELVDGSILQMACGPHTYTPQQGSLYHNEGGGKFREVTKEAGLGDTHGRTLGAMFCDFNGDGKPDLYVANDNEICDLYLNLGGGKFRNIGSESGTAFGTEGAVQSGMGVDWGDIDNDGRFDLMVGTFSGEPNSLYHNEGKNLFIDITYPAGIGQLTTDYVCFGVAFVDADNSGKLDLMLTNGHVFSQIEKVEPRHTYLEPSQFFRNLGGGKFKMASEEAGPDVLRHISGRGIAVGDYDGDGRLDMLVVDAEGAPLLLHNESKAPNHWVDIRCLQRPNGPDAIGALVTVSAGGKKQIAEARAGAGYMSTSSPIVHFGLGSVTKIDSATIRWPGGPLERMQSVGIDQLNTISRGAKAPPAAPKASAR